MKTFFAIAMTGVFAAAGGCQVSSTGGGVSKDEGFRMSVPAAVQVKQGEIQTVTVSLHRGEHFKRDVTVEARASNGVSVDPAVTLVRASEKPETQIRIAAPKDAALGEYNVYVRGTPASGDPTSVEIKVKVSAP